MTTLIDRQTLPETIRSLIGDAPRVFVSAKSDRVVLTPAADEADDEPEEYDIDPDDYPDTTAYLNAIPGMAESLIELMKTPASELEEVPEEYFHA